VLEHRGRRITQSLLQPEGNDPLHPIMAELDRLLTPGEVADLFRVEPRTVGRWARDGRLSAVRTPGGHRRYRESAVRALLAGQAVEAVAS
jgi:excisionase family DNA binding protein